MAHFFCGNGLGSFLVEFSFCDYGCIVFLFCAGGISSLSV